MLPPEVEEGNHEYKRYFKDIKKKRFFELSTQMCWRLEEGNGIAYYFIGVNDDGTIFNKLNKKQIKYSFKILNNLTGKCNSKITKIENNNEDDKEWFKVEIKRFENINKFQEIRILLLGGTNTGKSTFIANLIKEKLDINGNARNYVYNHKHELVSGNTSSINYYHLIYNENKYLFFDSPGNSKYIKTLLKLVQSIDYNLVLYFPGFDTIKWEYENMFFQYFSEKKIPIKTVNLCKNSKHKPDELKLDMLKLIEKDKFFKNINTNLIEYKNTNDEIIFNVLQTCYNNELGWLISGFLKSGKIIINNEYYWYTNDKLKIKVTSIHDSIASRNEICGKQTVTLCIQIIDNILIPDHKNLKYGFISNKASIKKITQMKIKWLSDNINNNQINGNIVNNMIQLKYNNKKENYNIENKKIYLSDNVIICYCQKNIGFII